MKKLFEDKENRMELIKTLLLGIVCIALAVLAYRKMVEIEIINLIFVLFAILSLREAFANKINKRKIAPLCDAAIISIVATMLNVELFDTTRERVLLESIFNWCTVWILIMAVAIAYLTIILSRNKRWTQEEYENWKALGQERKYKNREENENQKIFKKKYKIDINKEKLENKKETKRLKREARKNKLEHGLKEKAKRDAVKQVKVRLRMWEKLERPTKPKKPRLLKRSQNEKLIKILSGILTVVCLSVYLAVPHLNKTHDEFITKWVKDIWDMGQEMVQTSEIMEAPKQPESIDALDFGQVYEPIKAAESSKESEPTVASKTTEVPESAKALESTEAPEYVEPTAASKIIERISKYTVFYIAIIGIFLSAVFLLFEMFRNILTKQFFDKGRSAADSPDFMKEYAMSISILIVGYSVLIAFSGVSGVQVPTVVWSSLLYFLLTLLVLFVAVDVMKLILEQCMMENSLLRRCIRYVYILFINTAMDIILGVFYSLRISEWISSIASILIPVPDSELHTEIQKNIGEALKRETEAVRKGTRKHKQNSNHGKRFSSFQRQRENLRDEEKE